MAIFCAYFYFDGQLFIGGHNIIIGQRQQADLIESIWGVGDQLPEEDLKECNSHFSISLALGEATHKHQW